MTNINIFDVYFTYSNEILLLHDQTRTNTKYLAQKLMSSSMHEVFNWNGPKTTAGPKRLTLSVASSQIDFEGPSKMEKTSITNAARNKQSMVMVDYGRGEI